VGDDARELLEPFVLAAERLLAPLPLADVSDDADAVQLFALLAGHPVEAHLRWESLPVCREELVLDHADVAIARGHLVADPRGLLHGFLRDPVVDIRPQQRLAAHALHLGIPIVDVRDGSVGTDGVDGVVERIENRLVPS